MNDSQDLMHREPIQSSKAPLCKLMCACIFIGKLEEACLQAEKNLQKKQK